MTILTVGQGGQYAMLSSAISASQDGDVLQVKAGTYLNDFATINTKITIEGMGGQVNLVATTAPDNAKAILVTNTDVTLDNINFSGAQVADMNGAGIRYQGGNLVINNCYFHDNQDGLLAASDPTGSITIQNTEFSHNGVGDGYTHNLYVGDIAKLTVKNSYFHDALVGHEIKSRAATTIIQNNRIDDGPNGTASYSIDLPNGGNAVISGNVIEQGPNSQNPAIIHFGGEGTPYAGSSLQVSKNTILNDLPSGSATALLNQTSDVPTFTANKVFGLTAAQIANGPVSASGTTFLTAEPKLNTSSPWRPVVSARKPVVAITPAAVLGGPRLLAAANAPVAQPASALGLPAAAATIPLPASVAASLAAVRSSAILPEAPAAFSPAFVTGADSHFAASLGSGPGSA